MWVLVLEIKMEMLILEQKEVEQKISMGEISNSKHLKDIDTIASTVLISC